MATEFDCPHCKKHCSEKAQFIYRSEEDAVKLLHCSHCKRLCAFCGEKMLIPNVVLAPPPNIKLPRQIKEIYRESVSIVDKSPRAAAILLRLATEVLCKELGCKGRNLEKKIKDLRKKIEEAGGRPNDASLIERMLDSLVRKVGNKSAHDIFFRINEVPQLVEFMFETLNFVMENLIVSPDNGQDANDSKKQPSH